MVKTIAAGALLPHEIIAAVKSYNDMDKWQSFGENELCDDPWKGKVITFSRDPMLHVIQGSTLKEKSEFVQRMNWDMNTDFQKVFDLILRVAVEGNLKPE
ncbi:hypothetical protein ACFE04_013925 [Oxalis oulophora]